MVESVSDLEFPVWGLLPKQETGVTSFLTKYPEYDGRGINIAILDSGVDPGAPGLQVTSEGLCKVVERFDCSGCGDVNTSTVVLCDDGYITGLTGRKLKIPSSWKNVSNDYHIGVKNIYELYPSKLKERIESDRREKLWDHKHKIAVAEATREIQRFESNLTKKGNTNLSESETLMKEDVEARLEYLNTLDKKYVDLGPVCDCVVFFDGTMWNACIDTSEEGNLEACPLLGEYSKTHQFVPLTKTDQLNISINVHDNGNVLEIVGLCSGHGTHVASIASAYFPNDPEKNGVAPGAQIISLTIGDGRLGSMETGTALVRAMIKIMEFHKTKPVHVINMSYGEHANWSNSGRIGDLINEVVNKYGVVWVASAGNHGPALCTIGTPPDINQNTLIGVGAYVSPEMMVAEYSLRQKLPGMSYTWTSRGPTIDGDFGVSVCAPGAAITSVPNFTLRNAQLLNGTSMASPHVAGAVCVILSGLLKRNIQYSPYSVKRALENSARFLNHLDVFAQGHGLLQVENTFDMLANHHLCLSRDVRFSLTCGNNNSKGIHIRTGLLTQPVECTVNVEPCFKDCDEIDPETKINFGVRLALVCKTNFVQCPGFLDLQNMSRAISVKIDPTGLESGVHFTNIEAYDVACVEKGPMFYIPITVVQPTVLDPKNLPELSWSSVNFKPNTLKRHFILVPENVTWGMLKMHCLENGKQGRFIVHCIQIRNKQSCKSQEFQKMVQVSSQSDTFLGFSLKAGLIMELVVAKYWANLGDVDLDYSIAFYGIKPDTLAITMQAVEGLHIVELRSLRSEEIAPVITLKSSVQILKPIDSKLSPLTVRDIIPPGRQIYELVLTYEFHLSKGTEIMPNSPLFSDVLYESEFESQLWMLFDANKQMLSAGDAYANKYMVKLERGDYIIKLHIRHDKKDLLEKLTEIPMLISRKLASSISLDVYSSQSQAVICGKKMVSATGVKGVPLPIYISPFCSDKSKLSVVQGQYLTGTISYAKDEIGKRVDVYSFKFVPYDPPKKSSGKTDKEKSKLDEYNESLRDLKTSFLAKLEMSEHSTTLYEELKQSNPDHLAIHTAMMQCLDPLEAKRQLPLFTPKEILDQDRNILNEVIAIADVILNSIDTDKLLSSIAIKSDPRPDAAKIKSGIERQKTALLDALSRKGSALCRLYLLDKDTSYRSIDEKALTDISNIWKEMLKFVDPSDIKVSSPNIIYFILWHAAVHKQYGRVLKYLVKLHDEKPQKEIEEKCAEVCKILGWEHCVRYITYALPIKYPVAFRPF